MQYSDLEDNRFEQDFGRKGNGTMIEKSDGQIPA